ncbi:MAG: ABC transporter ATP-binding protein [Planctomycetota bacterium]|nr:ABC transporter ATP-binding protein [Planctomycetota bacterium]
MTASLLEIRGLSRGYGMVRAVDDVWFAMPAGLITGFGGPMGGGKTTPMRIVATLDVPDEGEALVSGLSVLEYPRRVRMKIGYMSDQFHPYPNLDVLQYLDFFARAYGLSGRRRIHTVRSVASFCGLDGFSERLATGLSKGMGQRLHLAKTLLHDPELLILDEPASGLDPRARIEFRALLKELAAAGKGILISSHILTELGEMCDSVVVIEKGRLEQAGTIESMREAVKLEHPVQMRVTERVDEAQKFLLTQPYIGEVTVEGDVVRFDFSGDDAALAGLLHKIVVADIAVVEFLRLEAGLEDIFLRSTRGALQ